MTGTLWSELGTTMRRIRDEAGVSLRELETRGKWRRSTISQVETGKARPSRKLVEWYDDELGTDGLLLSIYAEARSRQLLGREVGQARPDEDVPTMIDVDPPAGLLVNPGSRLQARLTIANSGTRGWRGRRLRRMGAHSGLRLIGSAATVPVPDAAPGDIVDVVVDLRAPELRGSVVAYWILADGDGRETAPSTPPAAILLVVG